MAEILSDQYKSVFSTPNNNKKIDNPLRFFNTINPKAIQSLSDIQFTERDIEQALNDLNPTSTDGPDGWSAFLLHNFRKLYATPIYLLWRKSLDSGEMPEGVNLAFITPIFKGGEKSQPVNYRPIALTSHLTKTFERVLRKAIIEHLATNNLINRSQHGFIAKRSTMTQLIEYYTRILDCLADKGQVDAVYLDFSKAFDKCDHGVISHKLKAYGIGGKIGVWVHNFLTQRQQQVRIMGHTSAKEWVTSGVPQGSVLGPLLFSILISDIDKGLQTSSLLSYADDTKLFQGIEDSGNAEALQNDLSSLYSWAIENNQQFNLSKFESISFSSSGLKNLYFDTNDHPIKSKNHIKDLGITISQDGSFNKHIDIITAKARQLTGWILRTFDTREQLPMLTLLKSLIIGTVEYCCPVWSPGDQKNIIKLERIQSNFTKRIQGMYQHHYWKRLKELKLFSLQRRRERYMIIYIWKIIHGMVPDPGITYAPTNSNTGIVLALPHLKGPTPIRRLKEQSLTYHGVRLYNSLPPHLQNAFSEGKNKPITVDTFKNRLDAYLRQIPDEPYSTSISRRAPSNSILDQVTYINNHTF